MPKQQIARLGRTILVVSATVTLFNIWGLIPGFIGWALLVYGTPE